MVPTTGTRIDIRVRARGAPSVRSGHAGTVARVLSHAEEAVTGVVQGDTSVTEGHTSIEDIARTTAQIDTRIQQPAAALKQVITSAERLPAGSQQAVPSAGPPARQFPAGRSQR